MALNSRMRDRLGFLLMLAILTTLTACTKISTSGVPQGNRATIHGVVRIAIIAEPNTLNPVLSGVIQEGYVEGAIFDGLVQFNDKGDVIPDLAVTVPSLANGGISRDGRTITYHLRHGVAWQDGKPFTSADVAFTYAVYVNPKTNGFYQKQYLHITRVDTPDPYTVVLHLTAPFAPALYDFFERNTGGFVIPKHLLEHSPDINRDEFSHHPLGTGPFRLVNWEHGSLIQLQANPAYFNGAPKVRAVNILIVPNPNTQVAMLASHELDVAAQLTPSQYKRLESIGGVRTVLVPTYLERFLTFNMQRALFKDPRVRRALAMALDRQRIVSTAFFNTAIPADSLLPPYSWAYEQSSGPPPYNPQAARALLRSAGWTMGSDNVLHKDGRPLSFGLLNQAESNPLSTMAQEVQRAWRDIGVETDIRQVPRNVIYGNPGLATDGKFDMLVDDWAADPEPDRAIILQTQYFSPHGYNDAFYSDPDVDRWCDEGLATYDRAERKRIYGLMQARLDRDLPYIPLVWEKRIYALNTDLRGFAPETIASDFWNSEQWEI